jgi:hypothetical protein
MTIYTYTVICVFPDLFSTPQTNKFLLIWKKNKQEWYRRDKLGNNN